MHEYSIVQSLIESCEENARVNNAKEITKVVVKIGVMSGVEPHLLEVAFNTFKEVSICKNAEFIINMQPIKIKCLKCEINSEIEMGSYTCPNCGAMELDVIDGEDIYLMQLEMI
jgi:hydrogenase nickel incorporation protein HypA/HybF